MYRKRKFINSFVASEPPKYFVIHEYFFTFLFSFFGLSKSRADCSRARAAASRQSPLTPLISSEISRENARAWVSMDFK